MLWKKIIIQPNILSDEQIQTLSKHWEEINVVTVNQRGRNTQCMDKQKGTDHYSAERQVGSIFSMQEFNPCSKLDGWTSSNYK